LSRKDPLKKTKTIIGIFGFLSITSDYNLVLVVNPAMVFANVIGSIINDILPSGVIMVLLTVLIFLGILINIYNAVKTYKKETKKIEEEQNSSNKSESSFGDTHEAFGKNEHTNLTIKKVRRPSNPRA
ncbi:MAG: hypothetical protein AAFP15_20240, partial [Bacteroidota bacterium]